MAEIWIQQRFPNLRGNPYRVTSQETEDYNCLAWAAEEIHRKWDPTDPSHFWPPEVPRETTKVAFIAAYETLGYAECDNGNQETGYQKIAIYANAFGATHAARQLPSGAWTSKLGDGWDIEHPTLEGIENPTYGVPVAYMRRTI